MSNTNTDANIIAVTDVMVGDRITFKLDCGRTITITVEDITTSGAHPELGELVIHDLTYGYAFQTYETVTVEDPEDTYTPADYPSMPY